MLLTEIETFLAIAARGNFRKAGEMLNVTQSTVSLRLKRLESDLDHVLVDRRRGDKQVHLTPAGESFLRAAEQIMEALRSVTRRDEAGSKLRVGSVDSVSVFLLQPVYAALRRARPPIQLEIGTHQSWQIYELMERGELDLGFTLMARQSTQVKATPFIAEDFFVMRVKSDDWPPMARAAELDGRHELPIWWGDRFALWHDDLWDPTVPPLCRLDTLALVERLMTDQRQWSLVPRSARDQLTDRFSFQRLDRTPPERVCYRLEPRRPRPSVVAALKTVRRLCDRLAAERANALSLT